MTQNTTKPRHAFTVLECTVVLAIIMVAALIVAQALVWSLRERARAAAHHAALELVANVLEAARAESFEKLDPTWAAGQTIPSEVEALLPEGKMAVVVEHGPIPSLSKRVTAEVRWQFDANVAAQSVRLSAVFAVRATKKTGGQP